MKKITKQYRNEILGKQELLNNARTGLKKEFFGIDSVIDEVIDSIGSWFVFPDLQERPVVVNLWGLTGTGKTALINRLTQYLNWQEKSFKFDLRNKKNSVLTILEDIYANGNGKPLLLSFDEFQNIRTIDELGNEIREMQNTIIWELLDSGKFELYPNYGLVADISGLIKKIKYFLLAGMKTEDRKSVV